METESVKVNSKFDGKNICWSEKLKFLLFPKEIETKLSKYKMYKILDLLTHVP